MLIKFVCDISTWMHDSKIDTQIQKTLNNTKNPTSFKLGKLSRAPCSCLLNAWSLVVALGA
jgi:hypothetical protein